MDEGRFSISAQFLYELLGGPAAPILVDVRRTPAFDADEWMIAGAVRRPPEAIERWQSDLARNKPVVVYCAHGGEVSQGAAASLRQLDDLREIVLQLFGRKAPQPVIAAERYDEDSHIALERPIEPSQATRRCIAGNAGVENLIGQPFPIETLL